MANQIKQLETSVQMLQDKLSETQEMALAQQRKTEAIDETRTASIKISPVGTEVYLTGIWRNRDLHLVDKALGRAIRQQPREMKASELDGLPIM